MTLFWAVLLTFMNLIWLFLTALGLPGNWLIVLTTALVAWGQRDTGMVGLWVLGAMIALAALGELIEFLGGIVGARRAGGTRWGALGAIVGGVIGALVGTGALPVLGTVVGACVGAFVGSAAVEIASGQRLRGALRAARGAGIGHGIGIVGKLAVGILIWLTATVAAFWP